MVKVLSSYRKSKATGMNKEDQDHLFFHRFVLFVLKCF